MAFKIPRKQRKEFVKGFERGNQELFSAKQRRTRLSGRFKGKKKEAFVEGFDEGISLKKIGDA